MMRTYTVVLLVLLAILSAGCWNEGPKQVAVWDHNTHMFRVYTSGYNGGMQGQSRYERTVWCDAEKLDSVLSAELNLAKNSLEKMP